VPAAHLALTIAGAAYLLHLAWQAVRPGGTNVFAPAHLEPDRLAPDQRYLMGTVLAALAVRMPTDRARPA
jgi:threonine/homoserine/homoserine lactone efflux protein